jgi:hypothetical protein
VLKNRISLGRSFWTKATLLMRRQIGMANLTLVESRTTRKAFRTRRPAGLGPINAPGYFQSALVRVPDDAPGANTIIPQFGHILPDCWIEGLLSIVTDEDPRTLSDQKPLFDCLPENVVFLRTRYVVLLETQERPTRSGTCPFKRWLSATKQSRLCGQSSHAFPVMSTVAFLSYFSRRRHLLASPTSP